MSPETTQMPQTDAEQSGKSLPMWDFKAAAQRALDDDELRTALARATAKFDVGRRQIMAQLPDSELVRERARQIKDGVLANLDKYTAQFADSVEAAGGRVHYATTGDEANAIITEIARERDVRCIVKSKSMLSEETHLNRALISEGFGVVETDLGEYILQLSDESPSHIVVPVVHRTKEHIAEVFNNAFSVDLPPVPEDLTALARVKLRDEFQRAEMGITGANFGIAATGTVVQVTNEGNGRLTTTWPKTHVVLMGIEKLLPTMSDLPVFLKLLARSATGQPLTVYTNLITGPRGEGEADGATELHVVLVDNGRTQALASKYREVLRCIRCGACLNTCPVYQRVGGHTYGSVYPGPIGSLLTPIFESAERFKDLPQASSLCGACYSACPVKINIPQMLVEMRSDQVEWKLNTAGERSIFQLWSMAMRSRFIYRAGAKIMRFGMSLLGRRGWMKKLPGPFAGWTAHRDFETPKDIPFHQQWARIKREISSR
jgi:L-lactate dehydrogenase complex protein LldF